MNPKDGLQSSYLERGDIRRLVRDWQRVDDTVAKPRRVCDRHHEEELPAVGADCEAVRESRSEGGALKPDSRGATPRGNHRELASCGIVGW
jgi:hypothetical protein